MEPFSPADEPASIRHQFVASNLQSVRARLDALPCAPFYVAVEDGVLNYRATLAARRAYGHARIEQAVVCAMSHETGSPRLVNVDLLGDAAVGDALVIIRVRDEPTVWVMLQSEYVAQVGWPLP